jgi:YebC/PmpR family DNA-binding regulatory protein
MGAQWKHRIRQASATARGRAFTKLTKEIIMAAKAGADPALNARLRAAVEQAKKASMPRETLERAIKKGAGLLDDAVTYELVTYEGFAPHQVPVIVECLTDNKNRTRETIRTLFRKGQLAASGAVAWDFDHVGMIEATGQDDAETAAIEAGAQDVEPLSPAFADSLHSGSDAEGGFVFYTKPADLDAVAKALSGVGWTVATMRLGWRAKNPHVLEDATARAEVEQFLTDIDDDDDVQHIYVGLTLL